jgi:hypothetical protein
MSDRYTYPFKNFDNMTDNEKRDYVVTHGTSLGYYDITESWSDRAIAVMVIVFAALGFAAGVIVGAM